MENNKKENNYAGLVDNGKKFKTLLLLITAALAILTLVISIFASYRSIRNTPHSAQTKDVEGITSVTSGQAGIYLSSSSTILPPNRTIQVWVNAGDPINFVHTEITFNTSQIKLVREVAVTETSLKRIVYKTPMVEANNTGRIVIATAVDPTNATNPPSGNFQLGAIEFTPNTTQKGITSSIQVDSPKTKIVSSKSLLLQNISSGIALSVNPIVTPPVVTPKLTFKPTDDATIVGQWVDRGKNYGKTTSLAVDTNIEKNFLVKFNVKGVGANKVKSAILKMYSVDKSPKGGDFKLVTNNNWSESTVTWKNAPTAEKAVNSFVAVKQNTWYSVDLTSVIKTDGIYSFRITNTSSDGALYSSKEGANSPILEISY